MREMDERDCRHGLADTQQDEIDRKRLEGPVWELAEAQAFLQGIQPVLSFMGVAAKVVGSVASKGCSNNDLDVVLQPLRPMSLDEIIEAVETRLLSHISSHKAFTPQESGCQAETWVLPIELFDGRLVEFYLPESDFPLGPDNWDPGNCEVNTEQKPKTNSPGMGF